MHTLHSSAPRGWLAAKLFGAAFALLAAVPATAQVTYSFNFDVNSTGWTGTPGFTRSTTNPCAVASMRRNMWSSATTGFLVSPLTGTSVGGTTTVTYDYKCYDFTGSAPTVAPWGGFTVQYASSVSGPWTTIATVVDEAQTASCITKSHVFTPPAGPLYVRWSANWVAGDYYLAFDNIDVSESVVACSGTPTPGDTIAPIGGVCSGANFSLSLQNATTGTGVSYQWYSSTTSSLGPWTAVGTGLSTLTTSITGTTWYYCDVTCSDGPSTGSSNVVQVDLATPVFPQEFSSGVVNPNCWSVVGLVGAGLPNYQAQSAFGVGTGSVRWNFYNIGALQEPTLVSPAFTPVAAGTEVFFDVAGATYTGGEIDSIVLEESNDGGTSWSPVVTMTNEPGAGVLNTLGGTGTTGSNFVPTASQWASLAYTLSAGTDRIRFRGISDFGNSVFLDNISVGVQPSARHTVYGRSCATPAMTLTSATPPVAGTTTIFDLNNIPLACPSPDPVFHFGIIALSLGQDFAGTDLLTGYGVDAPGCNLHITSIDVVVPYVDVVPTQAVPFDIPVSVPPAFLFFSQAAALICPNPPNNAGVLLSNGLRSYVNTF
ncbi:MAG: hypothetical protein KF830_09620 [Planctomycetes bacterium]|nr:hypothetical protein [Planctomycetota bacterium]